jgi:hypothetical protein
VFVPYIEGEEEYIRFATIGKNASKTKRPYLFYEIITNDISLMSEGEIDLILNKYNSLFQVTDEISFSQIKID